MASLDVVANRHFGKFADVWKHLVVDEVLVAAKPAKYAETHAGSAAYALVRDAERRYGVLGYLDGLDLVETLATAAFSRVASRFVHGQPALYPGSALQAMCLLGNECAYLLCDVDPESVDDLRAWAQRLKLGHCEVVGSDGMAAVRAWLTADHATVVHIDPFDPIGREEGGPPAVELAAEVADSGHMLVYWYGFSNPGERAWAIDHIRTLTSASLWYGEFMVASHADMPATDGDLGEATTPGTGCGVVLANVPPTVIDRRQGLAHALAKHYEGRSLPNGVSGHLEYASLTIP